MNDMFGAAFDNWTAAFGTVAMGRALCWYPQASSTNDLVQSEARSGAAEGLVIGTDEQTAGRGRMGRAWAAPPGSSLLMSVLLRPTWLPPPDGFLLTMLAATALCEAVEHVVAIDARLKWPNDLMLAGPDRAYRKAAGILTEAEIQDERLAWVVLGMGINVNWSPGGVVDGRDLGQSATSLRAANSDTAVDRRALLAALLQRLDARYIALRKGHREALVRDWRVRLVTLGREVSAQLPNGTVVGIAEDVAANGALLLRDRAGQQHVITAGDVSA